MAIDKIVLKIMPKTERQGLPRPIELRGDQGALIPNKGDRYLAPGFSMDIGLRKFEFTGDTLFVFLVE